MGYGVGIWQRPGLGLGLGLGFGARVRVRIGAMIKARDMARVRVGARAKARDRLTCAPMGSNSFQMVSHGFQCAPVGSNGFQCVQAWYSELQFAPLGSSRLQWAPICCRRGLVLLAGVTHRVGYSWVTPWRFHHPLGLLLSPSPPSPIPSL